MVELLELDVDLQRLGLRCSTEVIIRLLDVGELEVCEEMSLAELIELL
jgi:hypothetical protein